MTLVLSQPDVGLAKQINSRLADFDLLALLRLLQMEGYKINDIWFSSHESLASQDRLVEHVKLINERAFLSINLGLLGVHSPLPSTVFQQLDKASIKQRSLSDFLGFFDHLLILNYLGNLYPQINTDLFCDWEESNRQYLQIQNMRSRSSLYWLFQLVFPEFEITLKDNQFSNLVDSQSIYLGTLILGNESTFGGKRQLKISSLHIHLGLQREDYQPYLNWAEEALRRVEELIFPLLDGLEVYLKITFELGEHDHSLHLVPNSSLGYEILKTRELKRYQLCLHQGPVRLPQIESLNDIEWGVPCRIQV